MGTVVLHPTYAERLYLLTAEPGTGILYDDPPPRLVLQCLSAGWVEPVPARPGRWRLSAAGRRVHERLLGPD